MATASAIRSEHRAEPAPGAIDARGVNFFYGERQALRDVTFSIARGEIFGFLGPNGGGKTTLFKVLSTLVPGQSGEVRMLGRTLEREKTDIQRRMGVVFQHPSVDEKLTVRENLECHGHLYGMRGNHLRQRTREMLERVGLSDRAGDRVETLSGGLRRRTELAKALLHQPELLLLDEPSTGLDPGARIDLWRYLNEIRDTDGVTILVTTHLMDEAEHCDRLAIMDRGQLVACDSPAALKESLGGDVITLSTASPAQLAAEIKSRFHIDPQRIKSTLRIERDRGHEFIPKLVEAFPGMIRSISLGKPTLEDVFVHATGRSFESDPATLTG